jgi:hypothetical protein
LKKGVSAKDVIIRVNKITGSPIIKLAMVKDLKYLSKVKELQINVKNLQKPPGTSRNLKELQNISVNDNI